MNEVEVATETLRDKGRDDLADLVIPSDQGSHIPAIREILHAGRDRDMVVAAFAVAHQLHNSKAHVDDSEDRVYLCCTSCGMFCATHDRRKGRVAS